MGKTMGYDVDDNEIHFFALATPNEK